MIRQVISSTALTIVLYSAGSLGSTGLLCSTGFTQSPDQDTSDRSATERVTHWPGWLGPDRDGWVADFEAPKVWPETLRKVWQVDVGEGYGTPVVIDDAVFQHARQRENEVVFCLDRDTGKVRWRQAYEVPFKMGGGGEQHGKGPKSNAIYSDGRLFTFSIAGELTAWDAQTGTRLWQKDKSREFDKTHPYWGASTSPIVDENKVIVHYGSDDRGVLVAHDVETGEEIWRQGEDGAAYSSPLITEIDGVHQVIEWNHRVLAGIELETGRKLWEQPFEHVGTNQNMPTPALHDDCVLVGGENRGYYSFRPQREGDAWSVEEVWFQDKVALDMSSAVVNEGLVYGFSHYGRGRLFCLDADTGEIKWQGPGRAGQNVAFLAFPGHVVALMNGGELKFLKADGESFKQVASYKVADSETWAAPVLLPGGVLIKDKTTLTFLSFGN